jgi:hypothetical protein
MMIGMIWTFMILITAQLVMVTFVTVMQIMDYKIIKMEKLPITDREAMAAGYEGSWQNGWGDKVPEIVTNCNHDYGKGKRSIDLNYRGTLTITLCDVCKYYYMTDSGD